MENLKEILNLLKGISLLPEAEVQRQIEIDPDMKKLLKVGAALLKDMPYKGRTIRVNDDSKFIYAGHEFKVLGISKWSESETWNWREYDVSLTGTKFDDGSGNVTHIPAKDVTFVDEKPEEQ